MDYYYEVCYWRDRKKMKKCPVMMLVKITASNNNNSSIKYSFFSKEMSSVLYVDVELKSKPATRVLQNSKSQPNFNFQRLIPKIMIQHQLQQ